MKVVGLIEWTAQRQLRLRVPNLFPFFTNPSCSANEFTEGTKA